MDSDAIYSGREPAGTDHVRIGEADRDHTVRALADHFAAGRLTREELDHRTGVVLRARNGLDLAEVLADLPPLQPKPMGVAARRTPAAERARTVWRHAVLAPWAVFAVVFVAIWLFTGAGYFWPVWPILGWGIGVAGSGHMAYTLPQTFLDRRAPRQGCGGLRSRCAPWCAAKRQGSHALIGKQVSVKRW